MKSHSRVIGVTSVLVLAAIIATSSFSLQAGESHGYAAGSAAGYARGTANSPAEVIGAADTENFLNTPFEDLVRGRAVLVAYVPEHVMTRALCASMARGHLAVFVPNLTTPNTPYYRMAPGACFGLPKHVTVLGLKRK